MLSPDTVTIAKGKKSENSIHGVAPLFVGPTGKGGLRAEGFAELENGAGREATAREQA